MSLQSHIYQDQTQVQASACIDALFAISQCELRLLPKPDPFWYGIRDHEAYLRMAIQSSDCPPVVTVTKSICTLGLVQCGQLMEVIQDSLMPPGTNLIKLSQRADEALLDLLDMQKMLQEVVLGLVSNTQDYQADIRNLVQIYFGVVTLKSKDLRAWMKAVNGYGHHDLFWSATWSSAELLQWHPCIPYADSHSVNYQDIPGLGPGKWEFELYGHEVLAFLTGSGALPQVAQQTQSLSPPSSLSQAWFPIQDHQSWTTEEEHTALCYQLQPVSILLDFLEHNPLENQVIVTPNLPWTRSAYHIEYRNSFSSRNMQKKKRKFTYSLIKHLGPFTTVASILQDAQAVRLTALFIFIADYKFFMPKEVDGQIVEELLKTVFGTTTYWIDAKLNSEGSQLLLVTALREILDLERDIAPDGPRPFTYSQIRCLSRNLRYNLSFELALETAERLLGTTISPTPHANNRASTRLPPNDALKARTQGVYDYVVAQLGEVGNQSEELTG
ncbi:hypothetical protein C0991_008684 [Blastosporella zonata]|nr:hypothetical protein C0991_008684 [Blastosporella zonata]